MDGVTVPKHIAELIREIAKQIEHYGKVAPSMSDSDSVLAQYHEMELIHGALESLKTLAYRTSGMLSDLREFKRDTEERLENVEAALAGQPNPEF